MDNYILDPLLQRRETLLQYAAEGGHAEVMDLLIRHKISHKDREVLLLSAISKAALLGHYNVAALLLQHKDIRVNQRDKSGFTPLTNAARMGHHRVVEIFLEHKDIHVNLASKAGVTSLCSASNMGHDKVVGSMLRHKDIQVNQGNKNGQTPLFMAASKGHLKVVKLLMQHKDTKVDQATLYGETPLSIAFRYGHVEVAEQLGRKDDILEKKNKEPERQEELECIVCMDRKPEVVLVPCEHNNLCRSCAQKIYQKQKKCPIDRIRITDIIITKLQTSLLLNKN